MRKIYIVGGGTRYADWMEGTIVDTIAEADLVLFTGGEDVEPEMYGQPKHVTTNSNIHRDKREELAFGEALAKGKKMIGICRGSQFLCAMSGGILVQHQLNPSFKHKIKTFDGKVLEITSTHHQAAYPYTMPETEYKILGWTEGMLPFHKGGNNEELAPEKECEIVFYPRTNSLGIQGHPEMLEHDHPTIGYLQELLNNFMNDKL